MVCVPCAPSLQCCRGAGGGERCPRASAWCTSPTHPTMHHHLRAATCLVHSPLSPPLQDERRDPARRHQPGWLPWRQRRCVRCVCTPAAPSLRLLQARRHSVSSRGRQALHTPCPRRAVLRLHLPRVQGADHLHGRSRTLSWPAALPKALHFDTAKRPRHTTRPPAQQYFDFPNNRCVEAAAGASHPS